MEMKYAVIETQLGPVGLVGSETGLRRLLLPKPAGLVMAFLERAYPQLVADISVFGDLPERVRRYFSGEAISFPDPIDYTGVSPFRRAVYETTRTIPYGETRSYAWIARQIGRPEAYRAVGRAMAGNPVCIVIPCHRVIGSNGTLVGFAGGLEMKRLLLRRENAVLNNGVIIDPV